VSVARVGHVGVMFWVSILAVVYGAVLNVFPKSFARFGKKAEEMQGDRWSAAVITPAWVRVIGIMFIVGGGLFLVERLLGRGP
jgi:hypothetical protein